MNDVMQAVGVFFSYAVLAVFAQNAVFTRGLGVSRLVQLVGDERTSSGWLALLLCVTQVLVAPLAFYAGGFIVLGVLCAVWRTLAGKYKNYLTSEARGLMAVYRQREGEPQDEQ